MGKMEEQGVFVVSLFCFVLINLRSFLWGKGYCSGEGQIWSDEEMSRPGVHDVK